MNIPPEWTVEGRKAIGRFGERYEVKSHTHGGVFKPTGAYGWPTVVTVELTPEGHLEVNIDEQVNTYSNGFDANVTIPVGVLVALGVGR